MPADSSTPAAVQRPGRLALTDLALGLCSLPAGARIVDVGCGTGAAVRHLRDRYGYDATGIDPVGAGPHCSRGYAESLPAQDGSCDCVLCECVLSLLPDQICALREMYRVLIAGGYAVISDMYDQRRPDQLQRLIAGCGFAIIAFRDHSRTLREFAAAATLRGEPCRAPASVEPEHAGYCLIIARKA